MSPNGFNRREFLVQSGVVVASLAASGSLASILAACAGSSTSGGRSTIRVGQLTDMTGPNGFYGKSQHNTALLWADQTNQAGGILGKKVEIVLEDTATDPKVGATKARLMVEQDDVDVVVGGINSNMRDAIKGELVQRGKKLYFYPQLYEGGECTKYVYCTGPAPAQQVKPLIPKLMQGPGTKFYLPAADYVWPHTLNKFVRAEVANNGGQVVDEKYFPLDATDYATAVRSIMQSGTQVVFTTIVPPGIWTFFQQLHDAGFQARGGKVVCVWIDKTAFGAVQPQYIQGLVSCLDYFDSVQDPFSQKLAAAYSAKFTDNTILSASGTAGVYRALELWRIAVNDAKTVDRDAVAKALEHAKTDQSLGGPTSIAPGANHCVMNLYVATVQGQQLVVTDTLKQVQPAQCASGIA